MRGLYTGQNIRVQLIEDFIALKRCGALYRGFGYYLLLSILTHTRFNTTYSLMPEFFDLSSTLNLSIPPSYDPSLVHFLIAPLLLVLRRTQTGASVPFLRTIFPYFLSVKLHLMIMHFAQWFDILNSTHHFTPLGFFLGSIISHSLLSYSICQKFTYRGLVPSIIHQIGVYASFLWFPADFGCLR